MVNFRISFGGLLGCAQDDPTIQKRLRSRFRGSLPLWFGPPPLSRCACRWSVSGPATGMFAVSVGSLRSRSAWRQALAGELDRGSSAFPPKHVVSVIRGESRCSDRG